MWCLWIFYFIICISRFINNVVTIVNNFLKLIIGDTTTTINNDNILPAAGQRQDTTAVVTTPEPQSFKSLCHGNQSYFVLFCFVHFLCECVDAG